MIQLSWVRYHLGRSMAISSRLDVDIMWLFWQSWVSWVMRWKFRRLVELQTDRNGFWNRPIFSTFGAGLQTLLGSWQPPCIPWSTDNEQHSGQSINQRKKIMSTWTSESGYIRIYQDISGHSPAAPFRDQLNQVHHATVFVALACTDRWRRRPVKFGWPLPPPKKTHRDHRRRLRASPAGQPRKCWRLVVSTEFGEHFFDCIFDSYSLLECSLSKLPIAIICYYSYLIVVFYSYC